MDEYDEKRFIESRYKPFEKTNKEKKLTTSQYNEKIFIKIISNKRVSYNSYVKFGRSDCYLKKLI